MDKYEDSTFEPRGSNTRYYDREELDRIYLDFGESDSDYQASHHSSVNDMDGANDDSPSSLPLQSQLLQSQSQAKSKAAMSTLTTDLTTAMTPFLDSAPSHISNTTIPWLTTHRGHPAIKSLADVQTLLPRVPIQPTNDHWTPLDRAAVESAWLSDPTRARQLASPERVYEILKLHRTSLHLLRCLPEDIITQRHGLAYDPANNNFGPKPKPGDQAARSLMWNRRFCGTLPQLMVHPLFMNNPRLLIIAITYVVVVATDDRRPWLRGLEHCHGPDWFLSCVVNTAHHRRQGARMRDIRVRVLEGHMAGYKRGEGDDDIDWLTDEERKKRGLDSEMPVSPWNLLFERVEGLVCKDGKGKDIGEQPESEMVRKAAETKAMRMPDMASRPLHVRTKHLLILAEALDSIGPMGFPAYVPLAVMDKALGHALKAVVESGHVYPQPGDLEPLREYAILRERELFAYWEKHHRQGPGRYVPEESGLPLLGDKGGRGGLLNGGAGNGNLKRGWQVLDRVDEVEEEEDVELDSDDLPLVGRHGGFRKW